MRYDMVTRDGIVAPAAIMSAAPGRPSIVGAVCVVMGEPGHAPSYEEDIVPLFPEDATYDDPDYVPDVAPPPLRGMVKLRLDEVARKRGLVVQQGKFAGKTNLSAIVRGTGLAYATVNKLLRKPELQTGVSFEVLARLIEFLHCSVSDLLVYETRAEEPRTDISDYFKRQGERMGTPEEALF